MKLGKLVDERFKLSVEKLIKQDVPLKTAYKLAGVVKKINEELAQFQKLRQDALQKYCEKGDDGQPIIESKVDNQGNPVATYKLEGENLKKYQEEMLGLGDEEIEVPVLKLNDLGEKVELNVNDLIVLEGFIVD